MQQVTQTFMCYGSTHTVSSITTDADPCFGVQRVVDQLEFHSSEEATLALVMSVHANDCQASRGGFSPTCAALGREPRWPQELLDDRNRVVHLDSSRRQQQQNHSRLVAFASFWVL
eukprot:5351555-Amphidinium_carterae.1